MDRRNVQVEWLVAQDDDAWQRLQQTPLPEQQLAVAPTGAKHRGRIGLVWAGAFVLLLAGGVWVWRTSQTGLRQIEHELGEAVQVEVGALAVRGAASDVAGKLQPAEDTVRRAAQADILEDAPQVES